MCPPLRAAAWKWDRALRRLRRQTERRGGFSCKAELLGPEASFSFHRKTAQIAAEAVESFAVPMVFGIAVTASSPVFIATPILLFLGHWRWR
jgi:hypothetical protein